MALSAVNDVMALETYAPGFMLSPASRVFSQGEMKNRAIIDPAMK
jgi:hypothetical protein